MKNNYIDNTLFNSKNGSQKTTESTQPDIISLPGKESCATLCIHNLQISFLGPED